jgi:hypothetical protein
MNKNIEREIINIISSVAHGETSLDDACNYILSTIVKELPENTPPDITKERTKARQEVYHELESILHYIFNTLDILQVDIKKSDGNLQFTAGYNEGTFRAVKKTRDVLSHLWSDMLKKFMDKKNGSSEINDGPRWQNLQPGQFINVTPEQMNAINNTRSTIVSPNGINGPSGITGSPF